MPKRKGGLDYEIKEREWVKKPKGLTRSVLRNLVEQGHIDPSALRPDEREPADSGEDDPLPDDDPRVSRVPVMPVTSGVVFDDDEPDDGRPKGERLRERGRKVPRGTRADFKARLIRLPPAVEDQLQQLARARGMSLNSTVCIAITEDWRRLCK